MLSNITNNIRNWTYDVYINNTALFYRSVLEQLVPDYALVLDVGMGNGSCVSRNADLIRSKNLNIDGIDIDDDYISMCQKRIIDSDLSAYVSIRHQDLTKMDTTRKYDVILFTESFPVIPTDLMNQMMDVCRNMLTPDGVVIFIHNLEEDKTMFRATVKPLLRYIPGLWVDFGKLTTHIDFDQFVKSVDFHITEKRLIEKVSFARYWGVKIPEQFDVLMHQYAIVVRPNLVKQDGLGESADSAEQSETTDA